MYHICIIYVYLPQLRISVVTSNSISCYKHCLAWYVLVILWFLYHFPNLLSPIFNFVKTIESRILTHKTEVFPCCLNKAFFGQTKKCRQRSKNVCMWFLSAVYFTTLYFLFLLLFSTNKIVFKQQALYPS